MPVATFHGAHARTHAHTCDKLNQLNHWEYSACSPQPLRSCLSLWKCFYFQNAREPIDEIEGFLFSLVRVMCPPTLRRSSAQFDVTQELQPQTTWSLQMCIPGYIGSDGSVEMWVWKLSQDVYTAAFDECLLVCQRAACLTSKSWLLQSSSACSSDIIRVAINWFLFVLQVQM